MPLTSPELNDLDYRALETLLRGRIPQVAPEWTDHNESDPGIALIQLFAHMGEQLGYRLNRVPEKTYIEFLKLVGVSLRGAKPAETLMAFFLEKPARATQQLISASTQITASGTAGEPPVFETDAPLDVLPVQIAALVTTRNDLRQINAADDVGPTTSGSDPQAYIDERFSLAWDGKTPKIKDMPTQPVSLFSKPTESTHETLYVGLAFNPSLSAGFKGARASLHVQLHNDEEPDTDLSVRCGEQPLSIVNAFPGGPLLIEYDYYRPAMPGMSAGTWEALNLIGDDTESWTRSGTIRFEVPQHIGAIPNGDWLNVENVNLPTIPESIPHPLIDALKTPVEGTPSAVPISGWIRIRFEVAPRIDLRSLNFNTVHASHLKSINGERLGRGTAQPGQIVQLNNTNVQPNSVQLLSLDSVQSDQPIAWTLIENFDAAGPNDSVCVLDGEAGTLIFGDGFKGRPPQVTEQLIAQLYRYGGGLEGNVGTAAVNQPSSLPVSVSAGVNLVPAIGGRDADTLEAAMKKAPGAYSMRSRAVTEADFIQAALDSGASIAKATVITLRKPYPQGHVLEGFDAPGINMDEEYPGALTVVVVPDDAGPYPMPTTSELVKVAGHLDTVRLLTTDVHVTTPQYVRLFDLQVVIRAAHGYTLTALREAIGEELRRRFHVLTGGHDAQGYPFGLGLHHADLVAAIFSVPGVDRVEALTCLYDGVTPDDAERLLEWRLERRNPKLLTNCASPDNASESDHIVLLPDEVPFFDPSSMNIQVVGAP